MKLTPIPLSDATPGDWLRVRFQFDYHRYPREFQAVFLETQFEADGSSVHQALFSGRPNFGTTALPDYTIQQIWRVTPESNLGYAETILPFQPRLVKP